MNFKINIKQMNIQMKTFLKNLDVKVVLLKNQPFFKASDICRVLNLTRGSLRNFRKDEKTIIFSTTKGGIQECTYLSEIGCIRLIQRTRNSVPPDLLNAFNIQEHRFVSAETEFTENIIKAFKDILWLRLYNIGPFKLDLYSAEHKLVIEFDEIYHEMPLQKQADKNRENEILKLLGNDISIMRISEKMNIFDAIFEIRQIINKQAMNEYKKQINNNPNERCVKLKKFEVSKENLNNLVNIEKIPFTTLGKRFGVSDNAIRKRCRTLGVEVRKIKTPKISY